MEYVSRIKQYVRDYTQRPSITRISTGFRVVALVGNVDLSKSSGFRVAASVGVVDLSKRSGFRVVAPIGSVDLSQHPGFRVVASIGDVDLSESSFSGVRLMSLVLCSV